MDENENITPAPSAVSPQNPSYTTFLGSYIHYADDKGRTIVPSSFRAPLGDSFVVGPTSDFKGVALYPTAIYEKLLADIMSMNQRKQSVHRYAVQFAKLSYRDMQADGQGRLLLPAKIRQRLLEDAKELEISGAFDHVRILDNRKAQDEDSYFMDNLDEILDELGNLGE